MAKTVTVYDPFHKSSIATVDSLQWRVSAYGVLIEQDSILFQINPKYSYYNLPGGGINFGESLSDGLIREFLEETGYHVTPTKLIDVRQNYFTYRHLYFQNICLFYEVSKVSDRIELIDPADGDSISAPQISLKSLKLNQVHPIHQNIVKNYL